MFANATKRVVISQQVVATLVASALVLVSIGFYNIAQAAQLTFISDTLSTSEPSVASDHTIAFIVPTGADGLIAGETLTVTFPAGFNMGSVAFGDVDFEINSTPQVLAAAPAGATWGATVSGQVLTLTSGTGTLVPTDTVEIQIGQNATGGSNQITNPTLGSYKIDITAGNLDSGRTMVAIVDTVTVSAIVDTTFDFTITGLATSSLVNGETTTGSTSATIIDFGLLVADTAEILGQELAVQTNAKNGFVVTVEQDGDLQSASGAVIDSFTNGTYVNTPAIWAVPGDNIALDNTWGHWGLTSDDDINTSEFGSALYVAASTTPRDIFSHAGPADGLTTNIGTSSVAYKIEITPLQEAADDYSAVLTYIATPTF